MQLVLRYIKQLNDRNVRPENNGLRRQADQQHQVGEDKNALKPDHRYASPEQDAAS